MALPDTCRTLVPDFKVHAAHCRPGCGDAAAVLVHLDNVGATLAAVFRR